MAFGKQVIPTRTYPGMEVMPAQQFDRSTDSLMGRVTSIGGGGASNTTGDWPLKLVAVDTENVKVLLGTVNGFVPTGINTSIDVSGTNATWAIFLDATVDASTGAVTAVAVDSDNTNTVPADTSTHSYRLVGEVDVAAAVIDGDPRPSMAWSQNFTACTPGDPDTYHWTTGS